MFDADKSGFVNKAEFRTALETMGFDMTNAEFNKLAAKYDLNHDGKLSYMEFNANIDNLVHQQNEALDPGFAKQKMETSTQAMLKCMFLLAVCASFLHCPHVSTSLHCVIIIS